MKVYNLTTHPLDFHGRIISPNGGHLDFPELDGFLPSRDRRLEEQRIVAYGALPTWWMKEHKARPQPAHKRVTAKVVDVVQTSEEVKTEKKKTYR